MAKKELTAVFDLGDVNANTREVKLYSSEEVSVAVTFIENYYQTNKGSIPTIDKFDFMKGFGYGKKKTLDLLQSDELRTAVSRRGIPWPKEYNPERVQVLSTLSPQQQHAILVVTDPTRSDSLRKRLELVGISYQTWRNWMRQPLFASSVTTLAEDVLVDNMASVHTSMTAKAMAGDVTAARLVYELSGRHDPSKQQMVDMARIIGLLLESLTRHVTDSTILERLGKDFDKILSGETPQIEGPKPDFSFVEQIVDAEVIPDDAVQNPAQTNSDGTVESDVPERTEPVAVERDINNVPKNFFDI